MHWRRTLSKFNFIKMRIQGIWDCPDQDQEVTAKPINETQMFQITSREPMEPIDEEAGDLANLEDVSESKHANETTERIEDVNEENDEQITDQIEAPLPNILLDQNVPFRKNLYNLNCILI